MMIQTHTNVSYNWSSMPKRCHWVLQSFFYRTISGKIHVNCEKYFTMKQNVNRLHIRLQAGLNFNQGIQNKRQFLYKRTGMSLVNSCTMYNWNILCILLDQPVLSKLTADLLMGSTAYFHNYQS